MTWLLEMLFDSLRTMCAQFVVDKLAAVIAVDAFVGKYPDIVLSRLSDGKYAPTAETLFGSEVFEYLGMA